MNWTTKQVEEIIAIKNYEGWEIRDVEGILINGASSAALVKALKACLTSGFYITRYIRSFSDDTLRIYIE